MIDQAGFADHIIGIGLVLLAVYAVRLALCNCNRPKWFKKFKG